jgi:hypothetical protein
MYTLHVYSFFKNKQITKKEEKIYGRLTTVTM